MGNKDKGGRNTKKAATRSLKQKRAEKKEKREALKGKRSSGSFLSASTGERTTGRNMRPSPTRVQLAHKCRYVALLLYLWVVWRGLTRVAPRPLLGFWAA